MRSCGIADWLLGTGLPHPSWAANVGQSARIASHAVHATCSASDGNLNRPSASVLNVWQLRGVSNGVCGNGWFTAAELCETSAPESYGSLGQEGDPVDNGVAGQGSLTPVEASSLTESASPLALASSATSPPRQRDRQRPMCAEGHEFDVRSL
jgi:hypothetical protein